MPDEAAEVQTLSCDHVARKLSGYAQCLSEVLLISFAKVFFNSERADVSRMAQTESYAESVDSTDSQQTLSFKRDQPRCRWVENSFS